MAKIVRQGCRDELVMRARTDARGLGELYELYYRPIFAFCVRRLFDRETAEDVTSKVFLDVARSIRAFAGKTERDFRCWIYTIAANHTNSHIRKKLRRRKAMIKAAPALARNGEGSGSGCEAADADWPKVYAAIAKLPAKHQTVVTLRYFQDMEIDEIARIVKARPGTVRVTLHRALNKLRKQLVDTKVWEGQNE